MKFLKASVPLSLGISLLLVAGAFLVTSDTAFAQGIVPCSGTDCQACSIVALIQNVINFLIGFSFSIASALFAWAGVLLFTGGDNPGKRDRAKKIFQSAIFGFIIVLGSYLIINTILHTILDPKQYRDGSWFKVTCVDEKIRDQTQNASFGALLQEVLGTPPTPSVLVVRSSYVCDDGSTYDETAHGCKNANGLITSPRVVTSYGGSSSCSTYGFTAQQSCIASYESSCNPNVGSGIDIGADGNSVSWGPFQVNLSSHDVTCSNINGGQTLDCTSAFSGGAYTASNHNTYVVNDALYQQCKNAVKNVECSAQMQQQIVAAEGINAWGDKARANCAGL